MEGQSLSEEQKFILEVQEGKAQFVSTTNETDYKTYQLVSLNEQNCCMSGKAPPAHPLELAGVVVIAAHLIAGSIDPVFQKWCYNYLEDHTGYKFPLTLTYFRLVLTTVFLILWSVGRHFYFKRKTGGEPATLLPLKTINDTPTTPQPQEESWVFGRFFWRKMYLCLAMGAAFGFHQLLDTLSIAYTSLLLNILLKGTSVIFVLLISSIFKRERPSLKQILWCVLLAAGAFCIAWAMLHEKEHEHHHHGHHHGHGDSGSEKDKNNDEVPRWVALALTLGSAASHGVITVVLRLTVTNLRNTLPVKMHALEITMFKMFICSFILLFFAWLRERNGWVHLSHVVVFLVVAALFWAANALVHEGTCVAIGGLVRAVSAGIITQLKIFPQVILALLIFHNSRKYAVDDWLVPVGMGVIAVATLGYAWLMQQTYKKNLADGKVTSNCGCTAS